MKIKIYKNKCGSWSIRISGRNNRILLDASGYNTKRNAQKAITTILNYVKADNYAVVR